MWDSIACQSLWCRLPIVDKSAVQSLVLLSCMTYSVNIPGTPVAGIESTTGASGAQHSSEVLHHGRWSAGKSTWRLQKMSSTGFTDGALQSYSIAGKF